MSKKSVEPRTLNPFVNNGSLNLKCG